MMILLKQFAKIIIFFVSLPFCARFYDIFA